MDKDKLSGAKGRPPGKRKGRQRPPAGLEIEAAFEKWIAFLREYLGRSYSWNGPFANDLDRVNAIEQETALLVKIAPEWSAEAFYSAQTAANPDVTKGSEHYVTRYLDGHDIQPSSASVCTVRELTSLNPYVSQLTHQGLPDNVDGTVPSFF